MPFKLDLRFILNTVCFQLLWFACVLGAGGYEMHWVAWLALLPLAALTLTSRVRKLDAQLALIAFVIGFAIDNLWVFLGILSYPNTQMAPYWIGLLWLGLGASINHGLRFFRDLQKLGAMIVGVFAPITYLAGERMGAVVIESLPLMTCIAVTWCAVFFGLSRFARERIDDRAGE